MLEALASHLDALAALAPTWGLALVFVFMAVESSFIPFPSEVVMIPAGFIAARGEFALGTPAFALVLVIATGILGSLAGAYFNYWLSLRLGKPFLERYGKYFFVRREALDRACEVFNRYGAATTFVCRLVPVIRQLISIPAGISRMPLGSFTLFTGLGAGVWTAVLAVIGWGLAKSTGDISYRELVIRGKELVSAHLGEVIAGGVALAVLYLAVSKWVMGKRT